MLHNVILAKLWAMEWILGILSKEPLATLVAVLALFIAYRQWRTAQNRLKFDLFKKRLDIYDAANTFIASIETYDDAKDDDIHKYLVETRSAQWILDSAIVHYLEKSLYGTAVELQSVTEKLNNLPVGNERTLLANRHVALCAWFSDQYTELDRLFAKYLAFDYIT